MNYRKWAAFALPVLVMLAMFGSGVLRGLDLRFQDSLFQKPGIVSPDIYVIGIDEESLEELGPFQSWSRQRFADMIDLLSEDADSAPAVIGIDIGFYGNKTQLEDESLARAAERAGNVVVTSYASFGSQIVNSDGGFYVDTAVKTLEEPYSELRAVTQNGHSNVNPDEDGIIRHSLQEFEFDGKRIKSFAEAVYEAYTGEEAAPPLDKDGQWYIPYTGRPMDYFGAQGEGSSFVRVLNGQFPKEIFAGSIVLIGPYSAGMMDSFYTPVSRSVQMNGVEIHANTVQALLEGRFKREVSGTENLMILMTGIVLSYILASKLDFRLAGTCLAAATALFILAAKQIYENGYVLSVLYPVLGIWCTYIIRCFYNYLEERVERKKMMDIFSRYLSPQVVREIASRKDGAMALGGQKRDIAVLFVDIRGFTSLSEKLEPEQVVEFLNRYLELTTTSIFSNGGTVDKFIGDATMAVFNAPFELDDYVFKAVKTGLDMAQRACALQDRLSLPTGERVSFGIGIHCGDAVIGNIGTEFRMEYTAIGDTVNTASRLEGQAEGGEVIISDAVYERVKGRVNALCLGGCKLKGKAGEILIYKVEGLK
ncbi:adenylate/guanylate cyclase domain-containing protein [Lachnospiraceae bacterium NSJ-143]|nr:adenylate/guanylate cyclase domain-containing protein [Lachnospiraceae bacterium NSJ-143]